MAIVPGQEPEPRTEEPLLADEPTPPGGGGVAEQVEEMDQAIREEGSEEVQQADEKADAVEADADDEGDVDRGPGSASDSDQDPTSEPGADAEDPEAQQGEEPSGEEPSDDA